MLQKCKVISVICKLNEFLITIIKDIINLTNSINIKKGGNSMIRKNTIFKINALLKIVILTMFLFTLFPSSSMTKAENAQPHMKEIKITAHRGDCSKAPENTLRSIRAAIKTKSNYAEIDVQQSKDGQVILTHDSNFKRTAGLNKNVWDLNYIDLKKLDVGIHASKKYKGERIPTLKEAVKVAKNRIKLNIEIKTNGHEENIAKNVVKILEDNNFENQCVITSFDYNTLQQVRKLNKRIKIGYLIYKNNSDFSKLDVDFYSIDSSRATAEFINNAHSLNREVFVWTVNNKDNIKNLIGLGVDNIITDKPLLVQKTINSKHKMDKYKTKFGRIYKSIIE